MPAELHGEAGLADSGWAQDDQSAGRHDRRRGPPYLLVPAHELPRRGRERQERFAASNREAQPHHVMGESGRLEVSQLRPGLDPERLDESSASVLVGGEGLGRAAGEVPGPQQLPPSVFT
ncbi:MAG TPA: hypothetical protein VID94_04815 [Acidimicrobiales bacterium]